MLEKVLRQLISTIAIDGLERSLRIYFPGGARIRSNQVCLQYRAVLFASDFNPTAAIAVGYASVLSAALQTQLNCLHVFPKTLETNDKTAGGYQLVLSAFTHLSSQGSEAAETPIVVSVYGKEVSKAIVEYANKTNAVLIVLGSASLMPFASPSSTCSSILRHARCPIVIVSPATDALHENKEHQKHAGTSQTKR